MCSPRVTGLVIALFALSITSQAEPPEPAHVARVNPNNVTVLMGAFAQKAGSLKTADMGPGKIGWVENWHGRGDSVTWKISVPQPGDYQLSLIAQGADEGGEVEVQAAGRATMVRCSKGWDRIQAGVFSLRAGEQTVSMAATDRPPVLKVFSLELVRPSAQTELADKALRISASTDWLIADKYGLMFHWTSETKPKSGPQKPYGQAVRDFNVEAFAGMVQNMGARHVIFTTSHAGFYFPGPNEVIDSILKGRTCERDLIEDLADALQKRGIKLLVYYHPGHDDREWWTKTHFDDNKAEFFKQWCSIIRSIGLRYGKRVAGFWFDDAMFTYYPFNAPWQEMTEAAKAGNPERLVIYNSWILPRITEFYEVFAGENSFSESVIGGFGYLPAGGSGKFVGGPQKGLQGHITTFLEQDWGHFKLDSAIGPPRYSAEVMIAKILDCISRKNVPSIDLEIYQDGTVSPEALTLFAKIRAAIQTGEGGRPRTN